MQDSAEFVSAREMAKRLDMGLSTVWAKVHKGQLPKPDLKMGRRCTRWSWQNVLEHLKQMDKGANE